VDPMAIREEYGTDALRWYLLREMPTGQDASYTPERFQARYDELANVLGNLASRALSMTVKYRDGRIPDAADTGLDAAVDRALVRVSQGLEEYRLHDALGAAMDLAREANGYVETREPWAQAKDPARAGELDETLASLARVLAVLAALFQPVCPSRMEELAGRLGLKTVPELSEARTVALADNDVTKGDPLFPRIGT